MLNQCAQAGLAFAALRAVRQRGALARKADHSHDDESEEDNRRAADHDIVGAPVRGGSDHLDHRGNQRRGGDGDNPDSGEPHLRRCRLRDARHRGVEGGGAPQQVIDDPPSVERVAGVVAAVEQNPAVDRVSGQHGDDRPDQHVVGGATTAGADGHAHGDPEHEDVAQRVGDRNQLRSEVERVVVRVGRHQEDPRQEREPIVTIAASIRLAQSRPGLRRLIRSSRPATVTG